MISKEIWNNKLSHSQRYKIASLIFPNNIENMAEKITTKMTDAQKAMLKAVSLRKGFSNSYEVKVTYRV